MREKKWREMVMNGDRQKAALQPRGSPKKDIVEPPEIAPPAPQFHHIHLIINPASGQDRPILSIFNTVFRARSLQWKVSVTNQAGDAYRFAQEIAASPDVDIVGVYGGDGTVGAVAGGLIGSSKPLAIFPGGTANALASTLGIPADLREASSLINSPESALRAIDLGRINGRCFAVGVGIGVPGALIEDTSRQDKERLGNIAYALQSIQATWQAEIAQYRIILDDHPPFLEQGTVCAVVNASNFGIPNISIASSISLDDGLLDVLLLEETNLEALLSLATSVLRQKEEEAPFLHWQAREVYIEADPPQAIQADGEQLAPGPIHVSVVPAALRVILPASKAREAHL